MENGLRKSGLVILGSFLRDPIGPKSGFNVAFLAMLGFRPPKSGFEDLIFLDPGPTEKDQLSGVQNSGSPRKKSGLEDLSFFGGFLKASRSFFGLGSHGKKSGYRRANPGSHKKKSGLEDFFFFGRFLKASRSVFGLGSPGKKSGCM